MTRQRKLKKIKQALDKWEEWCQCGQRKAKERIMVQEASASLNCCLPRPSLEFWIGLEGGLKLAETELGVLLLSADINIRRNYVKKHYLHKGKR